jgi:hypothetical protein
VEREVSLAVVRETYKRELKRIAIKDFELGPYQRYLNKSLVKKIVNKFDDKSVGQLILSYRQGLFYIIDGQHRWAALLQLGVETWDCEIHYGLTLKDEADMFVLKNGPCGNEEGGRRGLNPIQLWEAEIIAGREKVVNIDKIVSEEGFKIKTKGAAVANNTIKSVGGLKTIYKKSGANGLKEILNIINRTWPRKKEALQERFLIGFELFYRTYKNDYDKEYLIDRLRTILPSTLTTIFNEQEKQRYKMFAKAIVSHYNYSKKLNRLDMGKLE